MLQEVLIDIANVLIVEFFSGWLLPIGFLLIFLIVSISILTNGITTVVWWVMGRTARKKEHFIQQMRLILKDMGADMMNAPKVEWPPPRPEKTKTIFQPVMEKHIVKKSLEDKLEEFVQNE